MKKLLFPLVSLFFGQAFPQELGDRFEGGIVFFLNPVKNYGLIVAAKDQAKDVQWGKNGEYGASNMDDGRENVKLLKKDKKFDQFAAYVCDTSKLGGYDDWYLPAINELEKIHQQRDIIGTFAMKDYCSSTEYGIRDSWNVHFRPHNRVVFYYNKVDVYNVRCVRRFEME